MAKTDNPTEGPAVRKMMKAAHRELLRAGDKLLRYLSDEDIYLLDVITAERQEEWRACLSGIKSISQVRPPRVKAAMAISEVALALETLMSRHRGNPETALIKRKDPSIKVGDRQVPAKYLASRIAEEADVELSVALILWNAIANLLIDGTMKLPGLISSIKVKDSVELRVDYKNS